MITFFSLCLFRSICYPLHCNGHQSIPSSDRPDHWKVSPLHPSVGNNCFLATSRQFGRPAPGQWLVKSRPVDGHFIMPQKSNKALNQDKSTLLCKKFTSVSQISKCILNCATKLQFGYIHRLSFKLATLVRRRVC